MCSNPRTTVVLAGGPSTTVLSIIRFPQSAGVALDQFHPSTPNTRRSNSAQSSALARRDRPQKRHLLQHRLRIVPGLGGSFLGTAKSCFPKPPLTDPHKLDHQPLDAGRRLKKPKRTILPAPRHARPAQKIRSGFTNPRRAVYTTVTLVKSGKKIR